jgi:hypothetical protein
MGGTEASVGVGIDVFELKQKKLSKQEFVKRGISVTGIDEFFFFKKNRLNSRVKELLWDCSCPNPDLTVKVLNSLSNDLEIGMDEDISVEQYGLDAIKIYPTDLSKEFMALIIPEAIVHYIFGDPYLYFSVKSKNDSKNNRYRVRVYNKRPYVDDLHTIKLEDLK